MQTNWYKKIGLTLVLAMTSCISVGCQNTRDLPMGDPNFGKAYLDLSTGEISLPFDAYIFSSSGSPEVELYQEARGKVLDGCMERHNFSYQRSEGFVPQLKHTTRYGVWNLDHAKTYGFDESPITEEERQKIEKEDLENQQNEDGKQHGQDYYNAYDVCDKEAEERIKNVVSSEDFDLLQQKRTSLIHLAEQARAEAVKDPQWQASKKEWDECIKKGGLTPRTNDEAEDSNNIYGNLDIISEEAEKILGLGYGPEAEASEEEGGPKDRKEDLEGHNDSAGPSDAHREEEIRIATIEAQCNIDTGLARKLSDIEASKQKKLMEDNEAILREEQEIRERIIKSLEEFIRMQEEKTGIGA